MKTRVITTAFATAIFALVATNHATAETPSLEHKLNVTPEIKKAFTGSDSIEIRQITGTAATFQVGGTYRVTGVCKQQNLKHAVLYIGNTAEAGPEAITAAAGSSLFKPLADTRTEFDFTFTVLRPGILHVTIYDSDNHDKNDNAYAGIYLGDVVFKH
ncbi:hypothetical protein CfE428DRAFT_3969 [Chthoniobacter flavus Ellin428]|uniref:Uncharacterized protein n=1 Tax=Chthoniobacter flavus Ellin428 TaxID=497964 RepID=B4D4Y1_9BACT|nr:hypothetical protein [Chthoniobacter flavus]EDY18584.1 hypothetical protein CfE428DRAFT_3969 [Chthoniobacter flavus Ellin428]TCO90961.1 hypothetical protein EV701_109111 [Chthoniobacter flavus]